MIGTRLAAEQAGIAGEHELQLLSEPEAAAIYSIKIQESAAIRVGDRIVVCDAGGGTFVLPSTSLPHSSESWMTYYIYLHT